MYTYTIVHSCTICRKDYYSHASCVCVCYSVGTSAAHVYSAAYHCSVQCMKNRVYEQITGPTCSHQIIHYRQSMQ